MGTQLGGWGVPGTGSLDITSERQFLWGGDAAKGLAIFKSAVIAGGSLDAGNTPTSVLRPGLVLGVITASGKYTQYDPTATNGSEVARAILGYEQLAVDFSATNSDRVCPVCVAGPVVAGQLLGLDAQARQHLSRQFLFDDDLHGQINPFSKVDDTIVANKTVAVAENGSEFQVSGGAGVTFTLPAIAIGLRFKFRNLVDQTMIVAGAVGDIMIATGDLAADSVEFSTPGEKIGACVVVYANSAGTKWVVDDLCKNTLTVNT